MNQCDDGRSKVSWHQAVLARRCESRRRQHNSLFEDVNYKAKSNSNSVTLPNHFRTSLITSKMLEFPLDLIGASV